MKLNPPMLTPRQAARMLLQVDLFPIDQATITKRTHDIQAAIRERKLPADRKRAGKSWRYEVSVCELLRWDAGRRASVQTQRQEAVLDVAETAKAFLAMIAVLSPMLLPGGGI